MKVYFRILSSIVLASLILAVLFSTLLGVVAAISGKNYNWIIFPFIAVWMGFLFFGLSGSIVGTCIYQLMRRIGWSDLQKILVSAILSTLICPPLLTTFAKGFSVSRIIDSYIMLWGVFPVAMASVLVHWYLYLRRKE